MLPGGLTYGGQLVPGGLDALLLDSCAAGQPDGDVLREGRTGQGTDMSEERYSAPLGLEKQIIPRFGASRRRGCFPARQELQCPPAQQEGIGHVANGQSKPHREMVV